MNKLIFNKLENLSIISMDKIHKLGQYFTTNEELKNKIL